MGCSCNQKSTDETLYTVFAADGTVYRRNVKGKLAADIEAYRVGGKAVKSS